MAAKLFAAIDVGSYEQEMKIFELSGKKGIRQIDDVRAGVDLGTESYLTGKIPNEKVEQLCSILKEFKNIMKSYQVDSYRAYGTSAIRETDNTRIFLDQIEQRTGVHVDVLSNSEQRFLDCKSVAFRTGGFDKILQEDTAILDIGGGSIQVSLFEGGKLITTQNMKLGVLRLRERLGRLNASSHKQKDLVEEIVAAQMDVFSNLYLQDRTIKNIIIVDDYLSPVIRGRQQEEYEDTWNVSFMSRTQCSTPPAQGRNGEPGYLRKKTLKEFLKKLDQMSVLEIVEALDISQENAQLLLITAVLANSVMSALKAEVLWAPGVTLCDGIAYEYAEKNHFISAPHDFEADIISSAENISNRYMGSLTRSATLQTIALNIYDAMKKIHGLGKRERLLLQLATLLHDCGKYISLVNLGDCSYNIIMSTEIIGLSHREREIVANVVKFNHMPFESYDVIVVNSGMSEDDYLIIAKLTAILRVANALDRSHKQKFKDVKMSLKDGKLEIFVDTRDDITVEKGLFKNRADFFEEVFFVKPVIRQKKYN